MAFDELKDDIHTVREEGKAYIESSIAYYKLWGFKVAMRSTTLVLKFILIILCLSMVLLFGSVAGALAIGSALQSTALGFLIVGGIYLVLMLLLFLVKDKIVEGSVLRRFSEIFFNE